MRIFFSAALILLCFAFVRPASAISISFNRECVYGDCSYDPYADVLPVGGSTSYNFSYTTTWPSTDEYGITGTVSAQNIQGTSGTLAGTAITLSESFSLTYLGNSTNTPTATEEIIPIDFGQNFESTVNRPANGYETASGTFSPQFNSAGFISFQADLPGTTYNFTSLTFRPPPASYSGSQTRPAGFINYEPLGADYDGDVYFAAGAPIGTSVSFNGNIGAVVVPTPEPATWPFAGVVLVALLLFQPRSAFQRKRG